MELTEKWLQSAAGWKAVKEARKIHGAGAVLKATYDPPLLQGIVQLKGKPSVAGMKILGQFDIDNLCKCWEARRNGGLCEHSVAVALAIILGNEAVTGRPKAAASSAVSGGASERSAGTPTPLPEPISVFLPRDFVEQWMKGRTGATLGMGIPPKEPAKGTKIQETTVGHSPEDTAFVAWLRSQGLVKLTTMLALPSELAGEMLGTLTGHPRVYRGAVTAPGKATTLRVAQLPLRRRITLKTEGKTDPWSQRKYTLQPIENKREGTVELPGDRPWLFAEATGMLIPVGAANSEALPPFPVDLQWIAERLEGITQGYEIEDPEGILAQLSIVAARPTIRLSLEGSLRNLTAELVFSYADQEVKFGERNDAFPIPVMDAPGRFLARNEGQEKASIERLEAAGFKAPDRQGRQFLSGEEVVMQFLGSELPALERSGWEIIRGERLTNVASDLERILPVLRQPEETEISEMSQGSGEDWLECELTFETASGVRVPQSEIRRMLEAGKSGVNLPGGSKAVIDLDAVRDFEEALYDADAAQLGSGAHDGLALRMSRGNARYLAESAAGYQGQTIEKALPDVSPWVPKDLWQKLRPYQQDGVGWIMGQISTGQGALVADEMGLGKTVQVLTAIAAWKSSPQGKADPRPALVVCPTSLVWTWMDEAAKWVPDLAAVLLHGSKRKQQFDDVQLADIVVTSYALLSRDLESYREADFDFAFAVFDEASALKNPDAQVTKAACSVPADRAVALSGTPVENSVADLWSIFQCVAPGHLGKRSEFKERYVKPVSSGAGGSKEIISRLRRRTAPFVLRRTKNEVLDDLPDKIHQTVFCELTPFQAETYRKILATTQEKVSDALKTGGAGNARMHMLTALLRLRQTACDLRLTGIEMPAHVSDPGQISGKFSAFFELMDEIISGGHRVLVFSQFVGMLTILREELESRMTDFCYLDGSSRDREAQVAAFRANARKTAFLISLKAGGYGLTLTEADTVIHFDPWWNPAVEDQATDRAHRIGQKKSVTAYKLITRGTVEEKILKLQDRKRSVFDMAMDDDKPMMNGLSTDDLEELLGV